MTAPRRRGALAVLLLLLVAAPPTAEGASAAPPALSVEDRLQRAMDVGTGWIERQWRRRRAFPVRDRAEQALAANQTQAAVQELRTYLAADPGHLGVRWRLAQILVERAELEAAVLEARQVLARTGLGEAHLLLAEVALRRGSLPEAQAHFRSALEDNQMEAPDRLRAMRGVIRSAEDRAGLEAARALAARTRLPADAELLTARAVLESRLNSGDAAERVLDELEARFPAEERRRAALAEAIWLQRAGDTRASLGLLQSPAIQNAFEASQTPPAERSLFARQISVLAEGEGQVTLAAAAARAVLAQGEQDGLTPTERLEWRMRAVTLLRQSGAAPRTVLAALRDAPGQLAARPTDGTPETWTQYLLVLAEAAQRAGEPAEAEAALQQLQTAARTSPHIALRVAQLQLAAEAPAEALATLRPWRVAGGLRPAGIDEAGLLNLLLLRASAARSVADRGEELRSLQEAAAIDSRVISTLDQAQRLLSIREFASALAVVQAAIPPAALRLAAAAPAERSSLAEDLGRLHVMRGEAARQAGDRAAALQAYEAALALHESWPVRWIMADLLRQQGRPVEAMAEYARLATSAPSPREAQLAWLTLGDQQWAAGAQAAALASFEGALAQGAGASARLRAMEAATQLGQAAVLLRLMGEAERDAELLASWTPSDRRLWESRRCQALASLRRPRPASCAPSVAPADRVAQEREAALADGYQLLARSQGEAAAGRFDQLFRETGDARAGLGLGEALLATGRIGPAVDILARLAQRANLPAELEARVTFALGQALDQAGQPARAAEAWDRSLRLRPDPRLALERLDALRRAGNIAEAVRLADVLAQSGVPPASQPRLDALRVRLALSQNEPEAARMRAEALADRFPSPAHWALLSEARAATGDRAGAAEAAEQALDGGASALARAGYAHLAAGERGRGTGRLRDALQQDPTLRSVRVDLAQAEVAAGHWSSARLLVRDALAAERAAASPDVEARQRMAFLRSLNAQANRQFSAEISSTLCAPSDAVGCRATLLPTNDRLGSAGFGGATIAWSPRIEGVPNRELIAFYARLLWANEPGTLQPQGGSAQGGVGIRIRPFESVPVYLWGERSIRLGAASQDNWLVRASFGRDWGTAWDISGSGSMDRGWAPYASLYADVGHFLAGQRDWLVVGEARAGGRVQPGEAWRMIPYGLLRGESISNLTGNSQAIMIGAGLAMQRRFLHDSDMGYLLTSEGFLRVLTDLERSDGKRGTRVLFGLALRL